jgi:3-oxoacyl-[acyl-carrier protein] reductase
VQNNLKNAIVTGGSRGIGRAIAKELASKGYSLLISDIAFVNNNCEEFISEFKKEINNQAIEVYAFKADASSLSDAQATISYAIEKFGGVGVLVNNAGITRDNPLFRMSEEDFDKVINVNLKSVFNYSKAVVKQMISQHYGRIVNISSVVGIIGNKGQANYSASKAGVIGFTKSLAKEVGSRNITVNAVAPGYIQTDMTHVLSDAQKDLFLKNVPLARMGMPEDVAKVVAFLCSEDAGYLTGQVINIDGGLVM